MSIIHKFRSKADPALAVDIGEYDNGLYYIVAAVNLVPAEANVFTTISEIEKILDDELELIVIKH